LTFSADEDMDALEFCTQGVSRLGTTGDPAELGGALALDKGTFCENLAARDAKNDPTLTPHPLIRSFA